MKRACEVILLLSATLLSTLAEAPSERIDVRAVADANQQRILVRWIQLEGATRRFTHFDLLRRTADSASFVHLNGDPIGALTTAAEIETLFTSPGNEDALGAIIDSLGGDFATDLLAMQQPGLTGNALMQSRLLPMFNYGSAIALGRGWIDDAVTPGTTYIYEVWGLDALGYPFERLGRASATAGAPAELAVVTDLACADMGGVQGDMAAFLRWSPPGSESSFVAGYDIYRVPRDPNPPFDCPSVEPGMPGVEKVNKFPTLHDPPGRVALGKQLFSARCTSCHRSTSGADPRDIPPSSNPSENGVKTSTIRSFRRTLLPGIWPGPHDHQNQLDLLSLSPEHTEALYDYIHEFEFRDDGADTPSSPLEEGKTYCYEVRPRNLLAEHGPRSALQARVECQVLDREPTPPPARVKAERLLQGSLELCDLSWERNAEPDDDTLEYQVYRLPEVPRLSQHEPPVASALAVVAQPGSGSRVTYTDTSLTADQMGESYFYAIRAEDDSGNLSGFSSWAPCIPRDMVAPAEPAITSFCECGPEGCLDLGSDPAWTEAGGEAGIFVALDPANCPPQVNCNHDGFGCRISRSFDGVDFAAGPDFNGTSGVPVTVDFVPLLDEKIWLRTKAYDKSGNLSVPSNPVKWFFFGQLLPAPQIVSVQRKSPGSSLVKIRFRSIQPDRVLGFSLYRNYEGIDEGQTPQPDPAELVIRYHDDNLGAVYQPGPPAWWAKKTGSTPLSQLPNFQRTEDPAGVDEFFYYNDLDQIYVLQADVGSVESIILHLHGIGMAGREGLSKPYHYGDYTAHDGVLDWPHHRELNTVVGSQHSSLSVSYSTSPDPRMELSWTAYPEPLNCPENSRFFIIFRKRGNAPTWQQLSPPFGCDGSVNLKYTDHDVQPGWSYTYRVIRLDDQGEFHILYGPQTEVAQ